MNYYNWMQEIGSDVALDFAHYMSSFSNGHLAAETRMVHERTAGAAESKNDKIL